MFRVACSMAQGALALRSLLLQPTFFWGLASIPLTDPYEPNVLKQEMNELIFQHCSPIAIFVT